MTLYLSVDIFIFLSGLWNLSEGIVDALVNYDVRAIRYRAIIRAVLGIGLCLIGFVWFVWDLCPEGG